MKKFLTYLSAYLVLATIAFFMTSLLASSANPLEWHGAYKVMLSVIWLILAFAVTMAADQSKD